MTQFSVRGILSLNHLSQKWGPLQIQGNAQRDRRNTKELQAAGWKVIRIWEHDLKVNPMGCVRKIMAAVSKQQRLLLRQDAIHRFPNTTCSPQCSTVFSLLP